MKESKMVIIEDSLKEIEEANEEIRKLLDLELPKNFRINWKGGYPKIEKKDFIGWDEIADIYRNDDIIEINFYCKEDFEELREYFEKSPTKFIIKFGDYY